MMSALSDDWGGGRGEFGDAVTVISFRLTENSLQLCGTDPCPHDGCYFGELSPLDARCRQDQHQEKPLQNSYQLFRYFK